MNQTVSLEDLRTAYRRTAGRIYRILEDGYDFSAEAYLVEALDRDALIIDAGFFVLIFGQIENRLNRLAASRVGSERRRRGAVRDLPFKRRLDLALPGSDYAALRSEIDEWYELRSDAAHGESLGGRYNVSVVFERAFELDGLVNASCVRRVVTEKLIMSDLEAPSGPHHVEDSAVLFGRLDRRSLPVQNARV